jgi:uncharacterized protein (DUF1697 family)
MPSEKFIALLRGINVTGRNKIPMAELRAHCTASGWRDVATYIQSGNVVFASSATARKLEDHLEKLISQRFGLQIPVIVRRAAEWPAYIEGNPFARAAETEANRVMLALSKHPPLEDALNKLRERAANDEKIERVGDAIWVHYSAEMARSKLTPALFDRVVGSPVTARNWRTVLKLGELSSS